MSQKRQQTGVQTSSRGVAVPLSRGLHRVAEQIAAEEHKKAQEVRRAKAAKKDGRIGKRVRFSDEEVAEMRRLHESNGWTTKQLSEKYEVSIHWMYQVLTYAVRSRYVYA